MTFRFFYFRKEPMFMQILLLIVASLLIGFSAGYRFKRKKLEKKITELKYEIGEKHFYEK